MNIDQRDPQFEEILDGAPTEARRAANQSENGAETWFPSTLYAHLKGENYDRGTNYYPN